MPYIDPKQRGKIAEAHSLDEVVSDGIDCAGDLNYTFTRIVLDYVKKKGERYQTYNDIGGAMLFSIFELYRRHIAQYEDEAIKRNGDV